MDELNNQNINSNKNMNNMDDILLNPEDKKTPVRDPLLAARMLGEQKKMPDEPINIKKNPQQTAPKNNTPENKKSNIKAVRTYSKDVSEMMKKQKTSLAQIVIAEQKNKEDELSQTSPKTPKNRVLKALSIIFIILGILIIAGGGFYFLQNKSSVTKKQKTVKSLIFAETQKEIDLTNLTKQKIINSTSEEIKTLDIRLDYIEYLYLTKKIADVNDNTKDSIKTSVSTQTFFTNIGIKMPGILSRSLKNKFMFGIHSFNGNAPFIILETNFFDNAFAGMLEWEKSMARDLFPLLGIEVGTEFYAKKFEDLTIKNRDMRVILDENKEILFLYSFLGRDTIIMTTNKDTLDEVTNRLQRP